VREALSRPLNMTRIVLAYAGGAAETAAIAWLRERLFRESDGPVEVVTLTLDLGQRDELDAVRERALAAGAARAHVLDVRESFARDYLLPALRAGAACDDGRPMGRVLSRPLIARQLVEVARMEGATRVGHGAWKDEADRARLDEAIRLLAPDFEIRTALAEWNPSDDELSAFADAQGLRLPKVVSNVIMDIWGRCARTMLPGGSDAFTYLWTKAPQDTPDTPAFVDVAFDRGVPVGISGVNMPLLEIISSLETIAGAHGVGRTEGIEPPAHGVQVREICESPAATVLHVAHRALELTAMPADLAAAHAQVRAWYLDFVRRGAWASVGREACQAFVDRTQAATAGTVRLQLTRGACKVVGVTVKAPAKSHREALAR
jgi:argininosuccinate synthase